MQARRRRAHLQPARRTSRSCATSGFGVPHVYGATRDGAMFGTATSPPRTACSSSTSCATSAARSCRRSPAAPRATASSTTSSGRVAPYTEADLQRQVDQLDDLLRRRGRARPGTTSSNYVAGHQPVHRRGAAQPHQDAGRVRGDRPAAGPRRLEGHRRHRDRRRWSAAIFGKGGGGELHAALCSSARSEALRRARGHGAVARLPLPPRTPRRRPPSTEALPLRGPARSRLAAGSVALPDAGSVKRAGRAPSRLGSAGAAVAAGGTALARPRLIPPSARRCPTRCVVSASSRRPATRSRSSARRPATSRPQILMEQDVHGAGHRRARRRLPRREPLRRARPRARLRVERDVGRPGHHRHVRRRPLRPDGARDDRLDGYRSAASAWPMETLERDEHLDAERRRPDAAGLRDAASRSAPRSGIVIAPRRRSRASRSPTRSCARPTCTRSTRRAASPTSTTRTKMHDAGDFQRAASKIGYTFNWLYADDSTSPTSTRATTRVRRRGTRPELPGRARAALRVARLRPGRPRPRATRRSPSTRRSSTSTTSRAGTTSRRPATRARRRATGASRSVYRSQTARRPASRSGIAGGRKMTLPELDRRDGGGRHDRPARRRGAAAGAEGRSGTPRTRAARRGRQAARVAARRRAPARPRPRRRPTSTPTRSGSWTRGGRAGCRPSSSRCSGQASSTGSRAMHELDNDAEQPRPAPRLGLPGRLVRLRAKDLRTAARRKVRGALRACATAATARARVPRGARGVARAGGRARRPRRSTPATRSAPAGDQVLRQRPLPPARRRDPAADPVEEPPDLPAGGLRARPGTALSRPGHEEGPAGQRRRPRAPKPRPCPG